MNVDLFGTGIFAVVVEVRSYWIRMNPNPVTVYKEENLDTERRHTTGVQVWGSPCKDRDRD